MNRNLRLVAATLPLLLLVFMMVRAHWHVTHAPVWHVPITGYDPRDLLRGHFLLFRLDMRAVEGGEVCARDDATCCYCLSPGDSIPRLGFESRLERRSCSDARSECPSFVRGEPLHALDRFFIPEAGRQSIEERFQAAARTGRAHLSLAIDGDGTPAIEGLYVDGIALEAEAGEAPTRPVDVGSDAASPPPP